MSAESDQRCRDVDSSAEIDASSPNSSTSKRRASNLNHAPALKAISPAAGANPAAAENYPSSQSMQAQATVFFNGIGYCSVSEAVCATMLELYVPGFQIIVGRTFQIDIGSGRTVDFMINGVLCEYHGIRLIPDRRRYGDFRDREEYHAYARELHRLSRNSFRRQRHIEATKERLAQHYFERRRRVIDEHPEYAQSELIVATSTDEFYERVVMRFNPQFCPTRADFMESFYGFASVIARQNSASQKQKRRRQAA